MTDLWNFAANTDHDQAARVAIFNRIACEDWKMPIDAWIAEADFAECNEAAIWFTGAPLTIVSRCMATVAPAGRNQMVRVTAPGYYAVIGA